MKEFHSALKFKWTSRSPPPPTPFPGSRGRLSDTFSFLLHLTYLLCVSGRGQGICGHQKTTSRSLPSPPRKQLLRTEPMVRFGSKHLLCQALLPALESQVKGNLTSFSPQKLLQYRLLGTLYLEFFFLEKTFIKLINVDLLIIKSIQPYLI